MVCQNYSNEDSNRGCVIGEEEKKGKLREHGKENERLSERVSDTREIPLKRVSIRKEVLSIKKIIIQFSSTSCSENRGCRAFRSYAYPSHHRCLP